MNRADHMLTKILLIGLLVVVGSLIGLRIIVGPILDEVEPTPPIAQEFLLEPTTVPPTSEPTAAPKLELTCMDMDVRITSFAQGDMVSTMFGEAILCSEQWYISSTYGPSIEAAREGGSEIVVRPWDGPKLELN